MADSEKLTSTQIGSISEHVVAARLMVASNGRLSPFFPAADDSGIDLIMFDKVSGRAAPIQIKNRTRTIKKTPNVVHFEVLKATFETRRDGYVLAVLFEENLANLVERRAWLIPMADFADVARKPSAKFVMRPSWDANSRDKYSAYRCNDLGDVARRLIISMNGPT